MLDSFSILERIIAIETKRWVNIQFFAGSLNRKPDMFKVTEHLFFHYTCFLRYFSDNHRPLLEKFNYLLTNCLHIGKAAIVPKANVPKEGIKGMKITAVRKLSEALEAI